MKIIYLGHHALGDVVMKIPAIRYLINKFGNDSVYFTVRDNSVKDFLINHSPLLKDNFLIYNNRMSGLEKISLIRYIRNLNFDYFILPPTINNKNGKFLFQLSNSKKLISHHNIHSIPKKNEVYMSKFKHKVLQNIEFVRYFENWNDKKILDFTNENYFLDNLVNSNLKSFNLEEKYIVLQPGSGGNIHKRYPVNKWQELITLITEKYSTYNIYVSGVGKEESNLANTIINFFDPCHIRIKSIVNKYSLSETMTIIRNSNLFISADCGPTHIASIMKTKMVTIFGPTDFEITGPYLHCTPIRITPKLKCMPCHLSKKYGNRGCDSVDCLQDLDNLKILKAIDENLK